MATAITPVLSTPDVARLHRFYADVFGAQESERMPPEGPVFYLGLTIGDAGLGLVQSDGLEVGSTPRVLLAIMVDDCAATLARVEPAGGTPRSEPTDMPWGHRVAHVLDLDGTMINITQQL